MLSIFSSIVSCDGNLPKDLREIAGGLKSGPSKIYVGGYYTSSSVAYAGYWENGEWHQLPPLAEGKSAGVSRMYIHGSDLYCCGYAFDASSIQNAVYWKNGQIVSITSGASASVNSLVADSGGNVYCAGSSGSNAFSWVNGTYTTLTATYSPVYANAIMNINGSVFIAGYAASSNYEPAIWENTVQKASFSVNDISTEHTVAAMAYDNGTIYIAGTSSVSGVTHAAIWKYLISTATESGTITNLPSVDSGDAIGSAIDVYNNTTYVVGNSGTYAACWINNVPVALPMSKAGDTESAKGIRVVNNIAYICGIQNSELSSNTDAPIVWIMDGSSITYQVYSPVIVGKTCTVTCIAVQ